MWVDKSVSSTLGYSTLKKQHITPPPSKEWTRTFIQLQRGSPPPFPPAWTSSWPLLGGWKIEQRSRFTKIKNIFTTYLRNPWLWRKRCLKYLCFQHFQVEGGAMGNLPIECTPKVMPQSLAIIFWMIAGSLPPGSAGNPPPRVSFHSGAVSENDGEFNLYRLASEKKFLS
jgi:hypothetical protein